MTLSVSGIKSRLQASFGAAQDSAIQDASLTPLAQALYNILTLYPVLSPLTALPGSAEGSMIVAPGTFLTTLQSAYPPTQDSTIQTNELTKLANGIEAVINNDAAASYPLASGGVIFSGVVVAGSITQVQAFSELKSAFGAAQDVTIQDSVLNPMAQGIANGILACTLSISLSVDTSPPITNITATGVIT